VASSSMKQSLCALWRSEWSGPIFIYNRVVINWRQTQWDSQIRALAVQLTHRVVVEAAKPLVLAQYSQIIPVPLKVLYYDCSMLREYLPKGL
jgi:hypothetical protein